MAKSPGQCASREPLTGARFRQPARSASMPANAELKHSLTSQIKKRFKLIALLLTWIDHRQMAAGIPSLTPFNSSDC